MKQNEVERQRLRLWLMEQNISARDLAEQIGLEYSYVTRILSGDRKNISPSFKWHFGARFGFDVARKIFDTAEPERKREPA